MVTLTHLIIAIVITWLFTSFTCLFFSGATVNKKKEKAYKTGYEQGYNHGFIDGRKGI